MKEKYSELLQRAKEASEKSYSPYSQFAVGSAVLTSTGKVFKGTNIENSSFSLTNCAERSALFNAISNGEKDIEAVAIWTEKGDVFPCGACRQVILELAPQADIIINESNGDSIILKISDLMPYKFDGNSIKRK